MKKTNAKSNGRKNEKNKLEWSVFALSLLFVLAIVSYLVYETVTHQPSPPDIEITYEKDSLAPHQHSYHVHVSNIGGRTAEDVKIMAQLLKKDKTFETSEFELSYLPKRSHKEGWVSFSSNIEAGDSVKIRVVSYKTP